MAIGSAIGSWTPAELRRFVANLIATDPSVVPPKVNELPSHPAPGDVLGLVGGILGWTGGLSVLFDQTLESSATSIDTGTGGIPATHQHLLVITKLRSDRAIVAEDCTLRFNGLSGATDYTWAQLGAFGGAAPADTESLGTNTALYGVAACANQLANSFGAGVVFIPSYTGAQLKNYFGFGGTGGTAAGSNAFRVVTGVCRTSGIINRIQALPGVGPNYVAGSRMTVYGIGT